LETFYAALSLRPLTCPTCRARVGSRDIVDSYRHVAMAADTMC